eukprot:5040957-Pyramimonas_sp.AAC.1
MKGIDMLASSWHRDAQWLRTGRDVVTLLDFNIETEEQGPVCFDLHRKELNLYLYHPATSNRLPGVFQGLLVGDATRTARRTQSQARLDRDWAFLQRTPA